jgi:predicted nucleotidyltransferase
LLEWLISPIVYRETPQVAEPLRALIPTVFSPQKAYHHYWHVARAAQERFRSGKSPTLKTFFYILRPLLAALWVDAYETPPPMQLRDLADAMLPTELHPELERLLAIKRAGRESDVTGEFGPLWAFAEAELGRLDRADRHFHRTWAPMDQLNVLFRRFLDEIWAQG